MNPKKILLVEDEDAIRELYKRQLDLAGFQTFAFPNGTQAIESLKTNQYNIALLDIMLPDINGLEILKTIKQNPATKALPCLMLTNLGQDEIIKEGFSIGAEGYLIKASMTPNQIVQEVNNALNKQAATPAPTTPQQPS